MNRDPNKTARTTLRQALLVNLAPIATFSVMILAVTGAVLGAVEGEAHRLASQLVAGELTDSEIHDLASLVQGAWLGSLAFFFLFTGGTVALSVWVHRIVARRVEHLVEAARRGAHGEVLAGEPCRVPGPLGDLERAIHDIGQSVRERSEALREESELSRLDGDLQRALDLTDTEGDALDVIERALVRVVPDLPAEVLLADSSRAHLRRVAVKADREAPGCPVERPFQCAAVRRGQTALFGSSEDLDACPKLREHAGSPCAAVCTPLNVMGRTIGVLHVTAPEGQTPDAAEIRMLEAIGTQAGARLGLIRTLATTQLQAQTDPLTGLMNRRSFEEAATSRLRDAPREDHALVMCDLDHFKRLNDTAGHEAGDRALELFADTLRGTLRPDDVIGRHGGEEFVIFLPGATDAEAVHAMERVRRSLVAAVERYAGPSFTASFGVASFDRDGHDLQSLVRRADEAMYAAKRRGRDRVVAAGEMTAADHNPLGETKSRRLATVS